MSWTDLYSIPSSRIRSLQWHTKEVFDCSVGAKINWGGKKWISMKLLNNSTIYCSIEYYTEIIAPCVDKCWSTWHQQWVLRELRREAFSVSWSRQQVSWRTWELSFQRARDLKTEFNAGGQCNLLPWWVCGALESHSLPLALDKWSDFGQSI